VTHRIAALLRITSIKSDGISAMNTYQPPVPTILPPQGQLTASEVSRIVEMAWEDRTPFEAIEQIFGLNESGVILLMRSELKGHSFRLWRERVSGRKTKHLQLRSPEVSRGYCPTQYKRS